jgi:hypothetical protein
MKIDLGQINPGAVVKISMDYTFGPAESSTIQNKLDQLITLQDQDGHFKWGDALLDFTDKTEEELISMRPWFTRRNDWITAMVFILFKAEDNDEVATLKARRYLSSRLNEKIAAKLIEKAFLELKPLVPGLEGQEQLFMRQRSQTPDWRQRLGEAVLMVAVRAAFPAVVATIFALW